MSEQSVPSAAELESRLNAHRGRDRWSGIFLALLMLCAFALVARQIIAVATGPKPPAPGVVAPDFTGSTAHGASFSFQDVKGKVVLVDFWATWCPPCVASMPHLQRLHQEFEKEGFIVVGVNQEPGDEARVRAFMRSRGITFPSVMDAHGIQRVYGVYSFPSSFLIDRTGTIRAAFRGPVSESTLRSAIKETLALPSPGNG